MTKTELLNQFAADDDSRIALGRLLDKAELARTRGVPANTVFFTPAQSAMAIPLLAAAGQPRHVFWGGYEGAERQVCIFPPDWQEGDDLTGEDGPVLALEAKFPPDAQLSHRDFLGAIMGLGITRECIGDLLVGDGVCQVLTLATARPILLSQWSGVGRYPVKLREIGLTTIAPVTPTLQTVRDTFQSLRFDAVASTGFGLPRTKAASLISSGKILLNHATCEKPDKILAQGDVLTGRGMGKCVLARITGQSKKGRIMVEMERYV